MIKHKFEDNILIILLIWFLITIFDVFIIYRVIMLLIEDINLLKHNI